jgi:uncharacterized protein involved in cysteine biosynthesis
MAPFNGSTALFSALAKALGQFDDPRIGHVIWKSLAWALVVFAILGVVFWYLGDWMAGGLAHWVDWVAHIGTVLLTLLLIWFLFPVAVTTVVSFYLEEVAGAVEERHYPVRPPPRNQPLPALIMGTLRFATIAIALNLVLVPIYLVLLVFPPLYLVVFYAVNGYLWAASISSWWPIADSRNEQPTPCGALIAGG